MDTYNTQDAAEPSPASAGSTGDTLWHRIRNPLLGVAGWAFFSVIPLLVTATAAIIAWLNGCELNEGKPHPCVVCGADIGETLYAMGMMAWLCLITLPVGGAMAAACAVKCVIDVAVWVFRRT